MRLPVMPPVKPMLAKPVKQIPPGMQYEGKWDGFRAIVFRDGDEVELGSRTTKPLNRYFPELVDAVREQLPQRCVVDGEIVLVREGRLDFEALQNRIHPAKSRITLLAGQTPASLVVFDLLALDDLSLLDVPLSERRAALAAVLGEAEGFSEPAGLGGGSVRLAPATTDIDLAREWFTVFEGAGLDGLIAKPLDGRYRPDERTMFKIKHERTADCVLAGYREHTSGPVVGSLLLGLFDDAGRLHHVGACAAFTMKRRRELVDELAELRMPDFTGHPWAPRADGEQDEASAVRVPDTPSRWNAAKETTWLPLRPVRVCEVAYDQMEGPRFRHTAQFRRWRPDREPESCTFDQLERPVRYALADVLAGPGGGS